MLHTGQILRGAALDLTEALPLADVLHLLLDRLAQLVPYDSANVMALRGEGQLAVQAVRGYEGNSDAVRGSVFEVAGHPLLKAVLDPPRTLVIPETCGHPGWRKHPGAEQVRNWIGVPLLAEGRVVGLLGVDKGEPRFFDEEHVRCAEALAPFAAVAIRNARLVHHDALTGLPNRLLLQDRLTQLVSFCRRERRHLAVLFLDLDRFKVVNDSLGHEGGDRLLRAVADRLRGAVREGDTVARLGGDEFVLLLPGLVAATDGAGVAAKVLELLRRRPFVLEGRKLFATASLGIGVFPDDGGDAGTLLRNAESAMYQAKEQGRDQHQLYTPAFNAKATARLALESSLRQALPNRELTLHYQPLVELAHWRVYAVEALLRWNHPDLGLLAPAEFIPVAEVTGVIIEIGHWVLREACAQAKRWQDLGHPELAVSVNLTARQFEQPDIVEQVAAALAASGLEPRFLDLEITESKAMQDVESTMRTLRGLKGLGIRLSIDDFGTGYSSLAYLRRFPIDTLKIDQSFIRDIATDPDDAALTTAVIAMAHNLKLNVVAEGVETADQLGLLLSQHCDRTQGFLFSRPLPPAECELVLSRSWAA